MEKRHLFEQMVEGEYIAMGTTEQNELDTINVRRARVDSISVYEVTEQELSILESGGDGGIYLNLALALFSLAVGLLTAIFTTSMTDRQFYVFLILSSIGIIGSLVFGTLWFNSRKPIKAVVVNIKARMRTGENPDKEAPSPDSVNRSSNSDD